MTTGTLDVVTAARGRDGTEEPRVSQNTPSQLFPPPMSDESFTESRPRPTPPPTRVEDTSDAEVGDNSANEAADAMIDASEADPVRPGEPADTHRGDRSR